MEDANFHSKVKVLSNLVVHSKKDQIANRQRSKTVNEDQVPVSEAAYIELSVDVKASDSFKIRILTSEVEVHGPYEKVVVILNIAITKNEERSKRIKENTEATAGKVGIDLGNSTIGPHQDLGIVGEVLARDGAVDEGTVERVFLFDSVDMHGKVLVDVHYENSKRKVQEKALFTLKIKM